MEGLKSLFVGQVLEASGWNLRQGIQRIWAGSRSIEDVAIAGEDVNDIAILKHILSQIVGSVADLRSDPAQKAQVSRLEHATARALTEEDRTWRCAARLATNGHSESSESSHFLAWVMETVEPRGLLVRCTWFSLDARTLCAHVCVLGLMHNFVQVAQGLSKILAGDRDTGSVTAGADLCDSTCLTKVLDYIAAIEAGTESADGWPTMVTLAGPNGAMPSSVYILHCSMIRARHCSKGVLLYCSSKCSQATRHVSLKQIDTRLS